MGCSTGNLSVHFITLLPSCGSKGKQEKSMNLNEMRALVRRDLKDEDAANYRWTDGELDRHIAHALAEISQAAPLEATATVATTSGSRDIDVSGLAGWSWCRQPSIQRAISPASISASACGLIRLP